MTTAQTIVEQLLSLPEDAQAEVLDFIEFIKTRKVGGGEGRDDAEWATLSLASAMRGMEDEQSPYTLDDLKESCESRWPA
jgi:hypothetical protein